MSFPELHRHVFDKMSDGLLVVRQDGEIETLNPTAAHLLGLEVSDVENRHFADLFIEREGFDELTQFVLDVVAQQDTGQRGVVEIRVGEELRSLSVAAFRITEPGDDGSDIVATGIVFTDLTELRELRETELRMAKVAEEQHKLLQDAYREIEERNASLAAALRRIRVVQGSGIVAAVLLFLGAGLWAWRPLDTFDDAAEVAMAGDLDETQAWSIFEVRAEPVSTSISIKGNLQPWRTVTVASPVDGTVAATHFRAGQDVVEGQLLVDMDVSAARGDYPTKLAEHAKQLKIVTDLENWEQSAEMSAARRSFRKAELDFESGRTKLNSVRFLFDEGLIPASQFNDEERKHQVQLLDFEAAKEQFAVVEAKGDGEELAAARLALAAAETELRTVEDAIANAQVTAPISGVVLLAGNVGTGLSQGQPVSRSQTLLNIGDFSRLAAAASVDETDIIRLRVGQSVTVTGEAFPGLTLKGSVTHVAAQAARAARGIPEFDLSVTLDPLGSDEMAQLRAGMSARLRIVVYENPHALSVPVASVSRRGGEYRVRVLDESTDEPQERVVEIGPTTLRRVEIVSGLNAGERILLPDA